MTPPCLNEAVLGHHSLDGWEDNRHYAAGKFNGVATIRLVSPATREQRYASF